MIIENNKNLYNNKSIVSKFAGILRQSIAENGVPCPFVQSPWKGWIVCLVDSLFWALFDWLLILRA